jgi:hypothetical protein
VLKTIVFQINQLIEFLFNAVIRAIDLLACKTIVPLYTTTVYDGVCTYVPRAVAWVISCTVIMTVAGMIMITTRAAFEQTRLLYPLSDGSFAQEQDLSECSIIPGQYDSNPVLVSNEVDSSDNPGLTSKGHKSYLYQRRDAGDEQPRKLTRFSTDQVDPNRTSPMSDAKYWNR